MNDSTEILEVREALARIHDGVKQQSAELSARMLGVEQLVVSGKGGGGSQSAGPQNFIKTQDGTRLPMLQKNQRMSEFFPVADDGFSLADYARAAVLGGEKASSGPALVPAYLSNQIIDAVRAETVLSAAGSATVRIEGPTTLARLNTSPVIYVHDEAVTDIVESDITLTPVPTNPKLLAALIPLSVELVEDSPNLDAILQSAISSAFALKSDQLNIAMILADAAIPKSIAASDPNAWLPTLAAIGAAMALNQAMPLAYIGSSADFIARASQLAASAGWLGRPPAMAEMLELVSASMPAGTAVFGDFARGFAIVIRSDLRLEIVRHGKPNSGQHLLVCHARIGGLVLQPGRLFKQLKTVV